MLDPVFGPYTSNSLIRCLHDIHVNSYIIKSCPRRNMYKVEMTQSKSILKHKILQKYRRKNKRGRNTHRINPKIRNRRRAYKIRQNEISTTNILVTVEVNIFLLIKPIEFYIIKVLLIFGNF